MPTLGLEFLISGGRGAAAATNFLLFFYNDTCVNTQFAHGMESAAREPPAALPAASQQPLSKLQRANEREWYQTWLKVHREAVINPRSLQSLSRAFRSRPQSHINVSLCKRALRPAAPPAHRAVFPCRSPECGASSLPPRCREAVFQHQLSLLVPGFLWDGSVLLWRSGPSCEVKLRYFNATNKALVLLAGSPAVLRPPWGDAGVTRTRVPRVCDVLQTRV